MDEINHFLKSKDSWSTPSQASPQPSRRVQRYSNKTFKIEMHKEFFDLELYVIDFSFKGLVSSRYLGLEVLNILVLDFGWVQ